MVLALFPLQLIVLPGEEVPLHIFESRYKELIADCRSEDKTFGMPAVMQGKLSKYGTELELVRVIRTYDGGEMDIIVRAKRVFRIVEYVPQMEGKLYSGASVEWLDNVSDGTEESEEELRDRFAEFLRLVKKNDPLDAASSDPLSFQIGRYIGLSLPQRLDLIALQRESKRRAFVLRHLNRVIQGLRESTKAPTRVGGNGHVRGDNAHA